MDNAILIEERNNIIYLTVNRPKSLNAINDDVMQGLYDFFTEGYKSYEDIYGVILTGSGDKAFVAGADIKRLSQVEDASSDIAKFGHDTFNAIERFHVPVIAAVNGFALGGGCEMSMACHMRVASENAKFGQPEVNLGLIPGYGGSQRLIQLIGKGKAMELLLTGDMIDAATAERLGLVNHVVSSEELIAKCESIINKIATKGPKAITKTIDLVNAHFDKNTDAFKQEYETFAELLATDEAKEGTQAFLEKRKANFRK